MGFIMCRIPFVFFCKKAVYLAFECLAIVIAERTIMPVPMQTFTIANKRFTFVIDFIIVLQSRDLNPCTYLYEHSKLKKNL